MEETVTLVRRTNVQKFERLMCEVEFWEVFLKKVQGFLEWCPKVPLVGCRIADLEGSLRQTLKGFSQRAGRRCKIVVRAALFPALGKMRVLLVYES